jgi:uncharacterized protein (TIGR03435 family)
MRLQSRISGRVVQIEYKLTRQEEPEAREQKSARGCLTQGVPVSFCKLNLGRTASMEFGNLMRRVIRSEKLSLAAVGLAAVALPVFFGLIPTARAQAQLLHAPDGPAPSFEVAAIRPSRADAGFTNYSISASSFRAENATLTELIRLAYDIKSDDQLPKDPGWIRSEKFDIDARIDDAQAQAMGKMLPDAKFEQFRLMMQSLLEDRFKLKVSTQSKELAVYALVVAKNGPHLTPAHVAPEAGMQHMPTLAGWSKGQLKAGAVSMTMFTSFLSGRPETGGRVVLDATGLKGSYDFTLTWTLDETHSAQFNGTAPGQGPASPSPPDSSAPSFLTALQEQLGLKLESRKAPVEVLVIDRVEQPSPN